MKLKIITVFGTRPEAIKMIPLIKEMEHIDSIENIVCVTGQHRQMLDQVLNLFEIKPDYDLDIMRPNQTLAGITTKTLQGLESVFEQENPDLVLVHGDTTTSFAAALSAFYNKIKVGHVEAGLRTYEKFEPFPEEINRKMTAVLADIHFAPTETSKQNLLKENIPEESIFVTGNTAIDMLKYTLKENYVFCEPLLNNIDFSNKRIITLTAHRRENLGEPLKNICLSIKKLVEKFNDVEVIYSVHYNPEVRKTVDNILKDNKRVHLIDPLDINDMHNLMKRSYLVMTDSGGLQEEVPSMDKPVLVLRNVTERPEGLDAGTLKLAGVKCESIFDSAQDLLINTELYASMAKATNPFGDGFASSKIIKAILQHFDKRA